jgi:hypothetical protein
MLNERPATGGIAGNGFMMNYKLRIVNGQQAEQWTNSAGSVAVRKELCATIF